MEITRHVWIGYSEKIPNRVKWNIIEYEGETAVKNQNQEREPNAMNNTRKEEQ